MSSPSYAHAHTPLIRPRRVGRTPVLALLLGRRGPSVLVRETAARELEERRADWGYSKPVVLLDIAWNTVFVLVAAVMLGFTVDENPNTPIRLWICGYAVQCLVHVALVWLEYRRRNGVGGGRDEEAFDEDVNDSEDDDGDVEFRNSSRSGCVQIINSIAVLLLLLNFLINLLVIFGGI
jgi:hypothetical protein